MMIQLNSLKYTGFQTFVIILTGLMYLAGIIGLISPSKGLFEFLTPFHLLVSALLLIIMQKDKNPTFWLFLVVSMLAGFFVEVVGVSTGFVFGSYEYSKTLGIQWLGVPLIIGVNWFLLVYLFGYAASFLPTHYLISAFMAALGMTCLDFFIEPVAIIHNFWSWEGGKIPFTNYFGWFATAFILQIIFYKLPFKKLNTLAGFLLIFQVIFFIVLYTIYSLTGTIAY